jgi:hypothetical protein
MQEIEQQLSDTLARREALAPAGDDLIATTIRRGRSRIRRRRGFTALSLAGALGVGLTMGPSIIQGGSGSSQAFAVDQHGTDLTVRIYRFDDAAGLQRQLAAHGVASKVVYTPKGKTCEQPWFTPSSRSGAVVHTIKPQEFKGGYSLTIRPSELADNDTLVIVNADLDLDDQTPPSAGLPDSHAQVSESQGSVDSNGNVKNAHARGITAAVAQGDVPACRIVDK